MATADEYHSVYVPLQFEDKNYDQDISRPDMYTSLSL